MTNTFHNTINLQEIDLKLAEAKCSIQEKRVFDIFKLSVKMTPLEVLDIYQERHGSALIGSIRRAISNLQRKGFLSKLDQTKMERYGAVNYQWIICPKLLTQQEMFHA